ncbi:metal ABC transporter solute-binding protein, Zn/Mn family [Silvimonas iriomotensis]|uniref:Metal ABC transporter substrate-binding protein n=1 Tax=Silvimonas iriomotensis TaxID=449662 RepID=A0ABQ2PBR9_9NEIS|nr:zinc ABC transporter substrate-binding protein [Silvimonas iriomotensis]GGP22763.1 metal ABC transporter substrate-binding protein [Silvimonas iriomotensis]
MRSFLPLTAVAMALLAPPVWAREIRAVASFTVLADIVRNVGGAHVAVTSLVGPNGDPHVYEPTPQDAKALKQADVVLISGLGLEGWMTRLIKTSGYSGKVTVASNGIHTRTMTDDGKVVTDPHAWNDMANGVIYTRNVIAALSAADPADAADFRRNGEVYISKLQALDAYAKARFATLPKTQRKVLTSHDAFGYFGAAYGVTFLSPVGISTEAEPAAADVARLIRQIRQEHVTAYFFENSNDPRMVKQIADATGAAPGGELYVEALSQQDGPAASYEAMFRYNVDTLYGGMTRTPH